MSRLFRNIVSLFLLLAFLFPSMVKMEHHHEHSISIVGGEKHFQNYSEICYVCDFEFSIFSADNFKIEFQIDKPVDSYLNHYQSANNYTRSKHSFQLRAPPFC